MDRIKVVCLGDSITYGWPWGPDVSWTAMLAEQLDGEVINRGIPGNTTTQMLDRFEKAVLKLHPSHVIIMGGLNDVALQDSFDRITWNLRCMAEIARENDIKVVFGQPTVFDEPDLERLVLRIRKWINNYAQEHRIPVIHFDQAFYDENNNILTDLLAADGAHPTKAGYQAMFDCIDLKVLEECQGEAHCSE